MTGTGLKKCNPLDVTRVSIVCIASDARSVPTTREAAFFPTSPAALSPAGTTAAAILVMLILDVFEANIASGRRIWEKVVKICRFNARDSETAWDATLVRAIDYTQIKETYLDHHVYIPQTLHAIDDTDSRSGFFSFKFCQASFANIFRQELVYQ